jgi:hypothetical protein
VLVAKMQKVPVFNVFIFRRLPGWQIFYKKSGGKDNQLYIKSGAVKTREG